jgi:FkbM family methyltransferase
MGLGDFDPYYCRAMGRLGRMLELVGVSAHRRRNVPFGVDWEQDVCALLGPRAKGATLIDVGANVGQTATSLAAVFPHARIFSFEPVPHLFEQLRGNTAGLPRVECLNAALGASVGSAQMTADRDGQNTLLPGVASGSTTTVAVDTLDEFVRAREIEHVNVLKIDTEGYESAVLEGAEELLAEGRVDFVLAECDFFRRPEEPHGDFFAIHQRLAAHGYHVVAFYSGGVDHRGWVWGDVLMARPGAVAPMPVSCSPFALG